VEPLDSLSLERGMKEEDRSDIVFRLSSLKEAPPSDDPVCRIGQGGVVHFFVCYLKKERKNQLIC
ncbi:hypothetical protein, partial [Methanosarcina sp. DH2]|uniref:hypothetical protein n=1 Tax=Methanosarcina sp. DH2 TaxID=2605639 RepID=UPI001E468E7E